ncbi:cytidylyltransferase domain-containing protein [Chloroflexota bacterium]
MKFTGIIPVRLNSQRVPFKSIRKIDGKPLINYAIATLNQVKAISETILYCSDETIKQYIDKNLSYTFVERPVELDSDEATYNDVLGPITKRTETDYIVYLSCTSPFLRSETIDDMITYIESGEFDSSFAAFNLQSFCWFKGEPLNYDPANVPRTQNIEPVLQEISSLYIYSRELFQKHRRRIGFKPYIKFVDMFEGWDIDTLENLKMAELIAARGK